MDGIDESVEDHSIGIVKVAAVLLIGALILIGVDSGLGVHTTNGVTITFDGQPTDGDTIMFEGYILEFDDDASVSNGHIPVVIGATLTETIVNLGAAVGSV